MKLQPFAKVTIFFISIVLTFVVGNCVREVTSPGSDPMSGRDALWGQHIWILWLFLFFHSSTELQPVNQFSRKIAQKLKFEGVLPPKRSQNWSEWAIPSQNKISNNFETVRDHEICQWTINMKLACALSDSVNKTCVERPLADKSRWRHIRLAIIPRCLGNLHAR